MDLTDEQWAVVSQVMPEAPRHADGRGRPWKPTRDVPNGNGRIQRVFFNDLARQAGYDLDWQQISVQQMVDASVLGLMRGDNSGFEQIFLTILTPTQP